MRRCASFANSALATMAAKVASASPSAAVLSTLAVKVLELRLDVARGRRKFRGKAQSPRDARPINSVDDELEPSRSRSGRRSLPLLGKFLAARSHPRERRR
jgi:hypothetical protein